MAEQITIDIEALLTVPLKAQTRSSFEAIHNRRKVLADIFFNKALPIAERNNVFEELNKIHKYLEYKELKKLGERSQYRIVTKEMRIENTEQFMDWAVKNGIPVDAEACAIVWSGTK